MCDSFVPWHSFHPLFFEFELDGFGGGGGVTALASTLNLFVFGLEVSTILIVFSLSPMRLTPIQWDLTLHQVISMGDFLFLHKNHRLLDMPGVLK